MQTQQKRELSGPEKLLEFSQNRPLGIKKICANFCKLFAAGSRQASLRVCLCHSERGINKNWIGPDWINPQIFPPNNRRLGIVFWGSIQSSPIQILSTAHSERLIHKVKTFVERLLLVKICFYNKQHIHK